MLHSVTDSIVLKLPVPLLTLVAALGTLNICLKFPTFSFNLFQMLRFSPRLFDSSMCRNVFGCNRAFIVSRLTMSVTLTWFLHWTLCTLSVLKVMTAPGTFRCVLPRVTFLNSF